MEIKNELEEIFELADNAKISLSVMQSKKGIYYPLEDEILINPCQSKQEFGKTFLHELYHRWAQVNNVYLNRRLEEYYAEKYAQEMYSLYKKEIEEYLKKRELK